jgi:hypothetical protein
LNFIRKVTDSNLYWTPTVNIEVFRGLHQSLLEKCHTTASFLVLYYRLNSVTRIFETELLTELSDEFQLNTTCMMTPSLPHCFSSQQIHPTITHSSVPLLRVHSLLSGSITWNFLSNLCFVRITIMHNFCFPMHISTF